MARSTLLYMTRLLILDGNSKSSPAINIPSHWLEEPCENQHFQLAPRRLIWVDIIEQAADLVAKLPYAFLEIRSVFPRDSGIRFVRLVFQKLDRASYLEVMFVFVRPVVR